MILCFAAGQTLICNSLELRHNGGLDDLLLCLISSRMRSFDTFESAVEARKRVKRDNDSGKKDKKQGGEHQTHVSEQMNSKHTFACFFDSLLQNVKPAKEF